MTILREDFLWGASTAAHQIEGNNLASDFWAAENAAGPGNPMFQERSGDACDSYHRYREDVRLAAEGGLNAYRFSIEWARIEPVTVLGPVRLRAWVSADAVDAHLHAALTEVLPDGASVLLTDGVLRLSARRGTDRRDPLPPGVAVEVEVDMWATGVHVPAGHRLRLDLAGSCWPRYAVADPAGGAPVRLTVLHDAEHPSELVLPLIDLGAHPAAL